MADTAHGGESASPKDRRSFIVRNSATVAMTCGLAGGYGTFAAMAGRFLFPVGAAAVGWQFVAPVNEIKVGESREYTGPSGAKVVIARQSEIDEADAFVALSSVCPHLGCQVHWESQNNRFYCPCHNGAFDPQGKPTAGPPAQAGQHLTRFPLQVEAGLLYVQVPLRSVTDSSST